MAALTLGIGAIAAWIGPQPCVGERGRLLASGATARCRLGTIAVGFLAAPVVSFVFALARGLSSREASFFAFMAMLAGGVLFTIGASIGWSIKWAELWPDREESVGWSAFGAKECTRRSKRRRSAS